MQTPAAFDYERATSVEGAIASLAWLGSDARIIAGGHSLLPMMKLRLANPTHLIDINDLAELAFIREDGGEVRIGALTRHVDLLKSELLARRLPVFRDAEQVIADPVVRNRGTIGGSLCQADPAEDLSAVAAALRADVVLRSSAGSRVVPAREFTDGPYDTVLEDAEMLVEVRIPIRPGSGSAYEKVERRAGDWAVASAGAFLVLDGNTVTDVGIGLAAVGADHGCAPDAEEYLRGKTLSADTIAEAGRLAAECSSPSADQRGPVIYKQHLADELTRRALRRAAARAGWRTQEGN